MPSNTVRFKVEVEGIDTLLRKLYGMPIFAQPWRDALDYATQLVYDAARDRAPFDTGALEAGTRRKLDVRPIPLYGVVTNRAENKGFRYGFALNYGGAVKKSGATIVYTYRQGSRWGQLTRHWFTGAMTKLRKQLAMILGDAAQRIEAAWRMAA